MNVVYLSASARRFGKTNSPRLKTIFFSVAFSLLTIAGISWGLAQQSDTNQSTNCSIVQAVEN